MFPILAAAGVSLLLLMLPSGKTILSPGRYRICVPPGTQSDPGFADAFSSIEDAGDNCFTCTVLSQAELNVPDGVSIARI